MPSRLPVRPGKIVGNLFVLAAFAVMFFEYYAYVFVIWGSRIETTYYGGMILIVFHFLFVMMLWSFIQTMITDAGQVPAFWGFHLEDSSMKKRRYCLMCQIYKPERCHHCSVCNRCVLNMDHHCPWINNCVGFWNRKYFLLLLAYLSALALFITVTTLYDFLQAFRWQINAFYYSQTPKASDRLLKCLVIQLSFTLSLILSALIPMFLRFHLYLLKTNKTTIENLEQLGDRTYKSVYDVGEDKNLYQVFGPNKYLWAFPVYLDSGKPIGNGVNWLKNIRISVPQVKSVNQDDNQVASPTKSNEDEEVGNKAGFRTPEGLFQEQKFILSNNQSSKKSLEVETNRSSFGLKNARSSNGSSQFSMSRAAISSKNQSSMQFSPATTSSSILHPPNSQSPFNQQSFQLNFQMGAPSDFIKQVANNSDGYIKQIDEVMNEEQQEKKPSNYQKFKKFSQPLNRESASARNNQISPIQKKRANQKPELNIKTKPLTQRQSPGQQQQSKGIKGEIQKVKPNSPKT